MPQNGVVPGATITVSSGSQERVAISDALGRYQFTGLPVGTVRARATLAGFVTARSEIQIVADRTATWNPVLLIRTVRSKQAPSGLDPTDPNVAAGVYDAILRYAYRGATPARPTIALTSLVQPFDLDEWPEELSAVPPSVRRASRTPEGQRPVTLRTESFMTGTRSVTTATASDIPYTSFSPVFLSDDGRGALVVFSHVCGNLCAEDSVAWLRHDPIAGRWVIHATRVVMLS